MKRLTQSTVRLAVKIAGQVDTETGRPLIGLAYEAAAAVTLTPATVGSAVHELLAGAASLARRAWRCLAAATRTEARDWQDTLYQITLALIPAPEVIYG